MKILCCCPCATNMINVDTVDSIDSLGIDRLFITGSLVYDAREQYAKIAIEKGYEYILFVDSDMVFEKEDFDKLFEVDADVVSGIYFAKKGNHNPIIYKKLWVDELDMVCHKEDFSEEEFLNMIRKEAYSKIEGCGMGFCLIKTSVCEEMFKRFGSCFMPLGNFGEDLSFCWRAKQLGKSIYSINTTHIGHIGDKVYTFNDYWKGLKNEKQM